MAEPVEVWVVPLDAPEEELRRLHRTLSPAERERAGEPPFSPSKRRYVVRQGALRAILGRRTGRSPSELRLVYAKGGKPTLAGGGAPCFSVSDSAGLALVALARRAVGVDLERVRERPAAAGDDRFFERWTRREATGKALGTGLLGPRPRDRRLACASFDVAPGFEAAVAVAAEAVEVHLRRY